MRIRSLALLWSGILLITMPACGDDGGSGGGADAALDSGGGTPDSGGGHGADAAMYEYDQNGCLTFASAGKICGFASDDSVCTQNMTCSGGNADQCKINCEMGTTVKCYKMADVDCLQHAVAAHDCAALAACMWIL